MARTSHHELSTVRPSNLGPSVIQLGGSGSSISWIGLEQVQRVWWTAWREAQIHVTHQSCTSTFISAPTWVSWGASLWLADRGGENPNLLHKWAGLACLWMSTLNTAALHPYSGVALKDRGGGKFSQWTHFWALYLVVHFVWREKLPELRTNVGW